MPDGFWRTRGGAAPDWFWNAREPWSQRALRAPLQLAECPYRGAARLHRAAYERGWVRRVRLPCRVVSVGNLTVGGSGKTPLVGWLAAEQIVTPQMAVLLGIATFGLYVGFGILIAVFRMINRLD